MDTTDYTTYTIWPTVTYLSTSVRLRLCRFTVDTYILVFYETVWFCPVSSGFNQILDVQKPKPGCKIIVIILRSSSDLPPPPYFDNSDLELDTMVIVLFRLLHHGYGTNSLPDFIKKSESVEIFKKQIKTFLFNLDYL